MRFVLLLIVLVLSSCGAFEAQSFKIQSRTPNIPVEVYINDVRVQLEQGNGQYSLPIGSSFEITLASQSVDKVCLASPSHGIVDTSLNEITIVCTNTNSELLLSQLLSKTDEDCDTSDSLLTKKKASFCGFAVWLQDYIEAQRAIHEDALDAEAEAISQDQFADILYQIAIEFDLDLDEISRGFTVDDKLLLFDALVNIPDEWDWEADFWWLWAYYVNLMEQILGAGVVFGIAMILYKLLEDFSWDAFKKWLWDWLSNNRNLDEIDEDAPAPEEDDSYQNKHCRLLAYGGVTLTGIVFDFDTSFADELLGQLSSMLDVDSATAEITSVLLEHIDALIATVLGFTLDFEDWDEKNREVIGDHPDLSEDPGHPNGSEEYHACGRIQLQPDLNLNLTASKEYFRANSQHDDELNANVVPVPYMQVRLLQPNGSTYGSAYTNKNGYWSIELESGVVLETLAISTVLKNTPTTTQDCTREWKAEIRKDNAGIESIVEDNITVSISQTTPGVNIFYRSDNEKYYVNGDEQGQTEIIAPLQHAYLLGKSFEFICSYANQDLPRLTSYLTADTSRTAAWSGEETALYANEKYAMSPRVVFHELGHYLQTAIFGRIDILPVPSDWDINRDGITDNGDELIGSHAQGDILNPVIAYYEGFANFIAAAIGNLPDLALASDVEHASRSIDFSMAPDWDGNLSDPWRIASPYNEFSVAQTLWHIYKNDGKDFSKIFTISNKEGLFADTVGFQTLVGFCSYYSAYYDSDDARRACKTFGLIPPFSLTCGDDLTCHYLNQKTRINGIYIDVFDYQQLVGEQLHDVIGIDYGHFPDNTDDLAEFFNVYEIPENSLCSGYDYAAGSASPHNAIAFGLEGRLNKKSVNLFGSKRLFACYPLQSFSDSSFGIMDSNHECQGDIEFATYAYAIRHRSLNMIGSHVFRYISSCGIASTLVTLPGQTAVGYTMANKEVTCFSYVEKGCRHRETQN